MKGRGVPGGVCPAARVVHPTAPVGRLSAGRRSETWPGGFARADQSRQPGTDRPGSSSRALLPRPRVAPGGEHLRDPPTSASAVGIPVPRGLPVTRQGGLRATGPSARLPSPLDSPLTDRAQPEGHRAALAGASVPGPCTWCPTRSECSEPYLAIVDSPLPRPSSDRVSALPSPGLQASGPSRCEPGLGGLFRGEPVAAVMRVDNMGAADRVLMRGPVPPSLPVWHHLFPPGPRAARRLCPVTRINLRAVLLGRASASESAALRFTGPVTPDRCRSGDGRPGPAECQRWSGGSQPPQSPPARPVVRSSG